MVRSIVKMLSVSAVMGFASSAYALLNLDLDAKAGYRAIDVTYPGGARSQSQSAMEYTVGASYGILFLPVAIYADLSSIHIDNPSLYDGLRDGVEVAAGVKAWVPGSLLMPLLGTNRIVPFAKIGHTLFGKYGDLSKKDDLHATSKGFNYHVGTKVELVPMIGMTVEYMYTERKGSVGNTDNSSDYKSTINAGLVGVEVSL